MRPAVVVAVPDAIELVLGFGTAAFDLLDKVVAHRLAVVLLPVLVHAQGDEDKRLLLVVEIMHSKCKISTNRGQTP